MEAEGIYENIYQGKIPPQMLGVPPKDKVPLAQRTPRIAQVILTLLVLALTSSLITMLILYFHEGRYLPLNQVGEIGRKGCLENSSSVWDIEMLQNRVENFSILYAAVREEYGTFVKMLSKGWEYYGGHLYYFSKGKKSWDNAEKFCAAQNSHLASVTSVEEQEFLFKYTSGIYQWIGLTDKGKEGTWHWIDGTRYNEAENRRFWVDGQPDNWNQGLDLQEDCVHFQSEHTKSWNDGNCNHKYNWICKKVLRHLLVQ
ncbi:C-type lectin domain family 4 member F-like [Ornithorhynchus anatinus]|uniref:C-type lectin domain family 4 member F-like n=1 Tax=Ornithorhynchus anatinus TaxID=9258 RepID=UPI0004545B37|nr:C-type lectin domain family 4 member F-like [Ornithorhynchus anatinus]